MTTFSNGHSLLFRNLTLVAALVVVQATAAPAFAQNEEPDEQEAPADQGDLVVTAPQYVPESNRAATKSDTPMIETPQSVTVITRDQIDLIGWQNVEQTVRYTSGVVGEHFGADERYDWFTLRGFSPVQYVDGLQSPVGSTSTTGIDLYGFETVEVLKGPSSVLYGQVPPGGLVNLTSRRPSDVRSSELQVQYGSYNHIEVAGDTTGSIDAQGRYQYRLTGLVRDREHQVDLVESRRIFFAPALTMVFSPYTSLTLLSHFQDDDTDSSVQFLPAEGVVQPNPNGKIPIERYVAEPGFDDFLREQYDVGYELKHDFNEAWSLHQGFRWGRVDGDFTTIFGAGLQEDLRTLNRFTFGFDEDIEVTALDTRLEGDLALGAVDHSLMIGIDYRRLVNDTVLAFGSGPTLDIFDPMYGQAVPPPPILSHSEQTQPQTGVYVQDHVTAGNWIFTASLRNDWVDTTTEDLLFGAPDAEQDDSEVSYRAGVNYIFDSGFAPYAAYSRSFLPTLGRDFNGNPFIPTKGEQSEAGIKYDARNLPQGISAYATLAVYDLTQENALTPDPVNAFFNVQTGEVEVQGLEFEAVTRIDERWSINLSYTYTDSEITESNGPDLGMELPMVPTHKASLFTAYTFQDGPAAGLTVGAGVRHVDETFGDAANTFVNESTTLVDAVVRYDIGDWQASLNANNLFDDEHVARCSSQTQCFYGPVRTIYLTLERGW
ncbi:TonB-dependent ferrichrome receptor FiuA [soil metagenome]